LNENLITSSKTHLSTTASTKSHFLFFLKQRRNDEGCELQNANREENEVEDT